MLTERGDDFDVEFLLVGASPRAQLDAAVLETDGEPLAVRAERRALDVAVGESDAMGDAVGDGVRGDDRARHDGGAGGRGRIGLLRVAESVGGIRVGSHVVQRDVTAEDAQQAGLVRGGDQTLGRGLVGVARE